MNKINLKEKIEVLNMHRITFAVVLFILLIVIASILLLVWWPVKPSLAEITNSWVALIMVYLVLSILLFEKPIYKFFEEFIAAKKSGQHDSQQSRQEQFLSLGSDINIGDLASLNIFENCKRKTLDGDFSMLIPIWSCTQNMFYSGFINPNW
jgi:hypothetical protein